jgi:hypothetical protein
MKMTEIESLMTQVKALKVGFKVGQWKTLTTLDEWLVRSMVQLVDDRIFPLFPFYEKRLIGRFHLT